MNNNDLVKPSPDVAEFVVIDNSIRDDGSFENNNLINFIMSMDEKSPSHRKFIVADYVDYNPDEQISKCLIKNCERPLRGRRTGNIKRHYQTVHKFIIVHYNEFEDSDGLEDYYENEVLEMSEQEESEISIKTEPETNDEETENLAKNESNESSQIGIKMKLEKYIHYDPTTNKSRCLVPGCQRSLEGKKLINIKRHYSQVHKCLIVTNRLDLKYLKSKPKVAKTTTTKTSPSPYQDLVIYDEETNTYQCLFINCNLILEKNLSVIKKHYREFHKIIAKDLDDMENHPLLKKRKYQHTYRISSQEDIGVKNEALNESFSDQNDEQPHCSTASKKAKYTTRKKSQKLDITITKLEYLKLCLGLVIKNGVPLRLFDDSEYFKTLISPYEQLFEYNLNSSIMETILIKANDIIVAELKEQFSNKIVCLEVFIIHHEECYYSVFNIRFIKDEVIYNRIIGSSTLTKSEDDIPIYEYLKKFSINNDQVYTRTITASNTPAYDRKLSSICYNICDNNIAMKFSPIYELQQILNIFIFKYIVDIKKWQESAEYDDKNFTNTMENFKKFKSYLENLNDTETEEDKHDKKDTKELLNAFKFMKTIQVCWNLMEKFDNEIYVVGDFYRDWLCCELELKELMKIQNQYAGELFEDFSNCKQKLLRCPEFLAALYLDPRFCFLGSRILNETQKNWAKLSLLTMHEKYGQYMSPFSFNADTFNNNDAAESNDDEYALLTQHINDTMPVKANLCLQDKLNNCVSTKREPFNLDILKYWRHNRNDSDLNQLSQVALSFPVSQYVLKNLEKDFWAPATNNSNSKFDTFLIQHNYDIFEKNIDKIFEGIK